MTTTLYVRLKKSELYSQQKLYASVLERLARKQVKMDLEREG